MANGPLSRQTPVATVNSPSSNSEIVLDINTDGRNLPLVGSTVALTNRMGDGAELAIGTILGVTTVNQRLESTASRGYTHNDQVAAMMGGDGPDTRTARVRLQAAWSCAGEGSPWRSAGATLRMSPATGAPVYRVDRDIITQLTEQTDDLHYIGHLGGTDDVALPMNMPDFGGPLGAYHLAVFGRSGAGKTAATGYVLASQMRHENMGIVIVDPQSQFSHESGLPFSLQGFARELGRDVSVRRISEDLRLSKNSELFTELLLNSKKFMKEMTLKSPEAGEIAAWQIRKLLEDNKDWDERDSRELLRDVLMFLADERVSSRIYTSTERRVQFEAAINDILESDNLFRDVYYQFAPLHNLFQHTNPAGGPRRSLWAALESVFERTGNGPAPVLILDMSSKPPPGLDDETSEEQERAYEVLEDEAVKGRVLSNLFFTLKRASEEKFRTGDNLNTLIVLDEAWRFAPPVNAAGSPEMADLSVELAGYARDTRKFGIGWMYITQSPRSLNDAIWQQLSVRILGHGLAGSDLDKVGEVIVGRELLSLYQGFADPRATGVYPFLVTGPVSPLAANATPVVLNVFTSFDDFRMENEHWITPIRQRLGEPVLTGDPVSPSGRPTVKTRKLGGKPKNGKSVRSQIVETNQAIRENRTAVGTADPEGFTDPYASLYSDDENSAPF